jgi:hypothetical protein
MRKAGAMAGTLEVRIGRPDAKAMRNYRYMWLVTLGGHTLGWGHTNRRDAAEQEAWDLITSNVNPDEVEAVQVMEV